MTLTPARMCALQVLQCGFDIAGQTHRIRRRLFLHADNDGRFAVVAGITAFGARGKINNGDLLQQDGLFLTCRNNRVAEVFDLLGQANVADQILAAVLVDEAATAVGAESGNRLLDLVVRDAERLHGGDVGRHPILAHLAADRYHLGYSGNGQKLRPYYEIRDLAHLHR